MHMPFQRAAAPGPPPRARSPGRFRASPASPGAREGHVHVHPHQVTMQITFGLLVTLHMMGWTLQADGGAPLRVRALGWPRGHTPRFAPVLGMLSQYALAVCCSDTTCVLHGSVLHCESLTSRCCVCMLAGVPACSLDVARRRVAPGRRPLGRASQGAGREGGEAGARARGGVASRAGSGALRGRICWPRGLG